MAKKLFKSKSNFTLRRLHQSGDYGNIYERDYTTIVNSTPITNGQIPIYNSPSFKLSVSSGLNVTKKYTHGNWLSNPNSCSYNSNMWTLGCMPEPNKNDSKIELKPNTKRLTDFACYGSSYDLIKSSLTDIVLKFPAELYVSNKRVNEVTRDNCIIDEYNHKICEKIISDNGYFIENPMFIDILQNNIPEDSKTTKLRYFGVSYNDYELIKDNISYDITNLEFNLSENNNTCLENGQYIGEIVINGIEGYLCSISCYLYDGNLIYSYGYNGSKTEDIRIRPKQNKIDEFFNSLNDFQKVLLNQYTNYTSTFETYSESDDNGWYMSEKQYQWPISDGGWNLMVNGLAYTKYVDDLTKLASGYDEFFTNSILRDMTHESISNMDLTVIYDDLDINSTKLKEALLIIGRQFDEIKKYADSIKNNNNISYSQDGNKPDYFLSDDLELFGWETKSILNEVSNDIKGMPVYPGYSANNIGFTPYSTSNEFLRRLKLNNKSILNKKGTKQAIEELMSLFGFHSTDWLKTYNSYYGEDVDKHRQKAFMIKEYTYVATSHNFNATVTGITSGMTMVDAVKTVNQLKDNFDIEDINYGNGYFDEYQGLPVAEVTITVPQSGEIYIIDDGNDLPDYEVYGYDYLFYNNEYYVWKDVEYVKYYNTILVPWFDKHAKYDDNIFFQMNGAWGRYSGEEKYLEITNITEIDNNGKIRLNKNEVVENTIPSYDNMPSYRKPNITGITEEDEEVKLYYIKVSGKYYEWAFDAKNIYDYTSNNVRYIEYISDLYSLQYNTLDINKTYYVNENDSYYKIKDIEKHNSSEGWLLIEVGGGIDTNLDINHDEVLYYAQNTVDNNKGNNPHSGNYDIGTKYLESMANLFKNATFENSRFDDTNEIILNCGFNITEYSDSTKCLYFNGDNNQERERSLLREETTRIEPRNLFNASNDASYTEEASLSIINSKKMDIIFDVTYKDFIEKDILPYLKQIIPSTTIFSYSFRVLDNINETFNAKKHRIICDGGICPIYAVTQE